MGVAGGATRAALTQHQALRDNMADVAAKDGSQARCCTSPSPSPTHTHTLQPDWLTENGLCAVVHVCCLLVFVCFIGAMHSCASACVCYFHFHFHSIPTPSVGDNGELCSTPRQLGVNSSCGGQTEVLLCVCVCVCGVCVCGVCVVCICVCV